ncbi:MAG TPA: hypothetical protein VFY21_04150 [Xanthobacteraceae bacterium]|nr:hypothetical protein [Xanthobacteraceae bacterium]
MSRPYRLSMFGLLLAAFAMSASTTQAQFGPNEKIKQPVTAAACKPQPGKPYFVEFRSRTAASYGHSFVLHGRLGANGRFGKFEVAGLHPKGYDPNVYMQGHVMPVPADTGASWGDLDEQYLTARYCVVLSEAEYQRTAAYIRRLQATSKEWHAPTNNCNSFIGDVARHMGLLAPPTPVLLPEHFVTLIKDLNGNAATLSGSSRS